MWSARTSEISEQRLHISLLEGDAPVSYDRVIQQWHHNSDFRRFWTATLIEVDWAGIRWETPPITTDTIDREFECVLIRSDRLERSADRDAFDSHFRSNANKDVIAFKNLGGDAGLVVPCPIDDETNYVHLVAFLRTASDSQIQALWSTTAVAMRERIGDQPVWLSTAGMGVAWLHVRMDTRPKYYGHAPYRTAS